jgi:hypothetical protein
MENRLLTAIIVGALCGLLTFTIGSIRNRRRNNRFAAEQAAQQEAQAQLVTQLMKTSLNDRMAIAITVCGMINVGLYELITPAMLNRLPWHWKFAQEFCTVAYNNGLGTFNALRSLTRDSYDEALNTLARSPEFMLFAARNSRLIDQYLDVYYSSQEIPREVRSEVYDQLVTKEYLDSLIAIVEPTEVQAVTETTVSSTDH